jgi:hypothetical protein
MAMEVALAILPDTEVLAWPRDAVRLQRTRARRLLGQM